MALPLLRYMLLFYHILNSEKPESFQFFTCLFQQNSHLIALQSFVEAQAQYFDQCHKTMLELQRHIQR